MTATVTLKGIPLDVDYTVSGADIIISEIWVMDIEIMCIMGDAEIANVRRLVEEKRGVGGN